MEDYLEKKLNCKLCSKEFTTLSVRKSRMPVIKTDSDFCVHYERETPYFYHVSVCPDCGYAFLDSFTPPGKKMREKLDPLPDDYSGRRDAARAEQAYRRAIECARMQRESDAVLASLYLQLAWVHRLKDDIEEEKASLQQALLNYIAVYKESDLEDASKVIYLIGELNRRLGNPKEAVFWYSRVADDQKCNKAIRRMAREAWQSLRD